MATCHILAENGDAILAENGDYLAIDGCTPTTDIVIWPASMPNISINSAENYWKAYRTKNLRPWLKR